MMANSRGYASSSEVDRMIIDLEYRSEGDTGNESSVATANETDVDSLCSPTKHADSRKSEPPSENVIINPIDEDLLDDIFLRTEKSETDENISASGDNDGVESVEKSSACDAYEIDNENDSDDENKLVIREEMEGDEHGAAEKATECEKEADVTWSDEKEAGVSEKATEDEKEADISRSDERGADVSERESDLSLRQSTSFNSIQYELSETFLDNLNPQDDSQVLDEEEEETGERDSEQGAIEKTINEDIGNMKEADVSQSLGSPEFSSQFEMSETFLDNLNPQDESQDLEEKQEERDGVHIVEDMNRDKDSFHPSQKDSPHDQACLLHVEENVGDEPSNSHKHDASTDEISLHDCNACDMDVNVPPSGLAETTTGKNSSLSAQQIINAVEASFSNLQDIIAVETTSDVHEDTESEVTSPHPQEASAAGASSPHEHGTTDAEASSPHNQETSADEADSSHVCQDVMREQVPSSPVCQETTTVTSSSTVQHNNAVEEALSSQEQEAAVDKSPSNQGNQEDMTVDETCVPLVKEDTAPHELASPNPMEQDTSAEEAISQHPIPDESSSPVQQVSAADEVWGSCLDRDSKSQTEILGEDPCSQDVEYDALSTEEEGDSQEERKETPPAIEEKDKEFSTKEDEDAREEGEYTSSPSSSSDPDEGQGGDVLHLSGDDLEARDGYLDNNRKCDKDENLSGDEGERGVTRSTSVANSDLHRNSDNKSEPVFEDVNSDDEEDCRRSENERQKENSSGTGDEDGIDIIETNVDLDDKDDTGSAPMESSSKESPALGVTRVIQRGSGDDDDGVADSAMVPAAEEDSDDDVQIIECPPQEPIDTLIVDDDDDEDDVPTNAVTSKTPVAESSRTSSKKKRTVEHDGHDLRIVIREERHEKDDSDRRRRRHDRDRREERRSDLHRRSESDRKSSDRSSRRRHHRSRSHSRERRRRRSRSRSRSRDRTSRRRRHRDRSREKSAERERSSHRKRRRDRSRERRHRSRSKSRSPKHSREGSWDKENRDDGEVTEHSRSKRRRYRRHEDKHKESSEEDRKKARVEESSVTQKSSQRQSRTWSPSDTFLKDPSDTPSSVRSPAEKSDDESEEGEASVEEVEQPSIVADKHDQVKPSQSQKEPEVISVEASIPEPKDIPIPKPEDIPIPETKVIPIPQPPAVHIPQPVLIPRPEPIMPALPEPGPVVEQPPLPPVPEEEPMENPPEPPPLPAWREGAPPPKGEGLLPTPIRRKAALEEAAAAVYDPAHPTDDEAERFMFPGVPTAGHPRPEMIGGPPHHPGQLMSDGTFVVPAPGEGGLLGPPPQRVPMQQVAFRPHRPMMMNPVVLNRPPFNNGPFPPTQLPGPPLPARFRLPIGGPGSVIPLQNQFGQGLPPDGQGLPPDGQGLPPESQGLPSGPLPPHQGFPGQLNERFEDGPPRPPLSQFPVSVPSGLPELANMGAPPGPLPSDIRLLPHLPPPPPDMSSMQDNRLTDEKFDRTLANIVVAQNILTVMKDGKLDGEPSSLHPPTSVFKVPPPPPGLPEKSQNRFLCLGTEPPSMMDQSEDSTEVMDMDMSPLDEDCELQLPTPPDGTDGERGDVGKNSRPLAAIDLRVISNAIKKLTALPTDDVPASAVELTNKEKYMKKLHLQERVVDEVKQALRPFYSHKKITKDEYKTILRKAVPKVCHSRSGDINPQKILQLVEGYVSKFQKQRQYADQKDKPPKTVAKEKGKANGERAKPPR